MVVVEWKVSGIGIGVENTNAQLELEEEEYGRKAGGEEEGRSNLRES